MSKPQPAEELAAQIALLLEKHEVHNEILALELAIMVISREKTQLKRAHRSHMESLNKAFDKHIKVTDMTTERPEATSE